MSNLNTTKKRILVAEDEADVLQLINLALQRAGFEVLKAEDGATAVRLAREHGPALIVMDIMMPGMTGLEACRLLKQDSRTMRIPVVMLTAKAEEVDRIVGLELGADDYVTKPFSPRELVLRIQAILRRFSDVSSGSELLALGPIQVDQVRHEVRIDGELVDFTATEFKLLTVLMERRGRLQSRDVLLNDVWGYESLIDTRTVDTHIRRLRDKLGVAAELVETVRGFGYRMTGDAS
jgi:DNA-binding response OmpR family regulator